MGIRNKFDILSKYIDIDHTSTIEIPVYAIHRHPKYIYNGNTLLGYSICRADVCVYNLCTSTDHRNTFIYICI